MKKSKTILLVLSLFILLFSSCKKDDNPVTAENPLWGTWELTKETTDGVEQTLYGNTILTIQSDNKFSMVMTYQGQTLSSTGTWSAENGKLTLIVNNLSTIYDYQLINSTKLVITITEDGIIYSSEYNKK